MGDVFSGSEIVEIGIQIEKNGRDFYATLVSLSSDIRVQEVFRFLAGEEEKHIKVFQEILEKTDNPKEGVLVSDDYFAYMNALASEHVFTKENTGRVIASALKTDKEALAKAMVFEKESIIFYEGIKKVVPDAGKRVIDYLIEQEKGHLKALTEIRELL